MIADWPCPAPQGPASELAIAFDRGRQRRLLIVPALFDEANRTRRFLIEAMRALDSAGIDSFLPDLPGCNESLQAFALQSLQTWRDAMKAAATHFSATEALAVRGGALAAPGALPCWLLEPANGASQLRLLLRARVIASREDGRTEKAETLLEQGRMEGLVLAGYRLSAALVAGLEAASVVETAPECLIRQNQLGGGALWLRSEPGEDAGQSAALAAIIARGLPK